VNLRGEVVGVNSAIASPTGYYSGYGFAVPIDLARRISDDLIRYREVRRPALGVSITEVTPEDAEVYKLARIQGVVAQDFPPNSPARAAGLQQGDVIVAVEGKPIQRVGQFQRIVASFHPGDRVRLDVMRYGQRRQFTVTLTPAATEATPQRAAQAPAPAPEPDNGTSKLGVAVSPLTGEVARQLGYRSSGGVVITGLQPYGPAARAGLAEGVRIVAVDGRPVNDVAGFRAAMAGKRPGDVVSLQVEARVQNEQTQNSIINIRLPD